MNLGNLDVLLHMHDECHLDIILIIYYYNKEKTQGMIIVYSFCFFWWIIFHTTYKQQRIGMTVILIYIKKLPIMYGVQFFVPMVDKQVTLGWELTYMSGWDN